MNEQNQQAVQPAEDIDALRQVRLEKLQEMQANGEDPFTVTKFDVTASTAQCREMYEQAEKALPEPEVPLTDDFAVSVEDGVYVVTGSAMEHLIESVNFDDEESLNWFHRTLRRLGVIDALREQGAGEGSTVSIGDMEFDFID